MNNLRGIIKWYDDESKKFGYYEGRDMAEVRQTLVGKLKELEKEIETEMDFIENEDCWSEPNCVYKGGQYETYKEILGPEEKR